MRLSITPLTCFVFTVGALFWAFIVGTCYGREGSGKPVLFVPDTVIVSDPVPILVTGLPAGKEVLLRGVGVNQYGQTWRGFSSR